MSYLPAQAFSGCDLHIPYKKWGDNPQEEQNYEAIEQWALHFRTHCLPQPNAGGAITTHRVVYGFSHGFRTASLGSINYLPGDGTSAWWEWGVNPLTDDQIAVDGCFGINEFGRVKIDSVSGRVTLPISKAGLLSWHGTWDGSAIVSAVGGPPPSKWVVSLDDYTDITRLQQNATSLIGSATWGTAVPFGGSYYVEAGVELSIVAWQNSGTDHPMDIQIMLTLLEF